MVNVVQLGANETVSAVVAVDSLDHDDTFLMLGTRNGKIKRIALSSIGKYPPIGSDYHEHERAGLPTNWWARALRRRKTMW